MFKCSDMMNLPSLSKAELLSGEKGMNNEIRWVYKPESMDFDRWIKGGELLIISKPLLSCRDFDMLRLIQKAVRYRMSGAIVLVGEAFIKRISQEVLAFSDRYQFPVFSLPWTVPLIDVFEEMGNAIVYHQTVENSQDNIISHIIFDKSINAQMLYAEGERIGYDITAPQQMIVICADTPYQHFSSSYKLTEDIKKIFDSNSLQLLVKIYSKYLIGITKPYDSEKLKNAVEQTAELLKSRFPKTNFITVVGRVCKRAEDLPKSYREAVKCTELADRSGEIIFYDRLGFYRLLLSFENDRVLGEYAESILGPLIEYDHNNHSEMLKTLECYLKNGCSMISTAEKLHAHKNTVRYRLQRIEMILNCLLSDPQQCLELYNALLIWNYLSRLK